MGHVMQTKIATMIINPDLDERYNEIIDLKTSSPFYCFPILDPSNDNQVVGCIQFENKDLKLLRSIQMLQK